jgi:hypothetical protein
MPNFAPLKIAPPTFDDAHVLLSGRGFEVVHSPGGRLYTVSKYGCTATIEAGSKGMPRISGFPACLIGGESAELVDRGFQKFFKTSKLEVPATAERLATLHRFSEELKEALGFTSLYNEGLGSVSAHYHYDRVTSRDLPEASRPKRAWQK